MRARFAIFVALATIVVIACGANRCRGDEKSSAYEQNAAAVKTMIAALEKLADALEEVKDGDSAKAAATKINALSDELEDLSKTVDKLPKIDKEAAEKLKNAHYAKLLTAGRRLGNVAFNAFEKSEKQPDFIASVKRLEKVGKTMERMAKKLQAK